MHTVYYHDLKFKSSSYHQALPFRDHRGSAQLHIGGGFSPPPCPPTAYPPTSPQEEHSGALSTSTLKTPTSSYAHSWQGETHRKVAEDANMASGLKGTLSWPSKAVRANEVGARLVCPTELAAAEAFVSPTAKVL